MVGQRLSPNAASTSPRLLGLGVGLLLLGICFYLSLIWGAVEVSLADVYRALIAFDGSQEQAIVRLVRLPRSLAALAVGAALAAAGTILQGITRNPLAAPSTLGIHTGASFAVVAATFWFKSLPLLALTGFALLGAIVGTLLVYLLASQGRGGVTPANLAVAGAALTALFSSLTTTLLILSQRTLGEIRFWLAGSLSGRDFEVLFPVLPCLGAGILLAIALCPQMNLLALGERVAAGLGQRTGWVKILAAICVVLLAGGSVALAGPIGFVGLIVPTLARILVGTDFRWLLPQAMLLGGGLLLVADTLARIAFKPLELPVSTLTATIGAPFFLYLVGQQGKR
ncbi:MAG: iron ABC transporter permease [Cyanobacteria bacterium J06641_5]